MSNEERRDREEGEPVMRGDFVEFRCRSLRKAHSDITRRSSLSVETVETDSEEQKDLKSTTLSTYIKSLELRGKQGQP